MMVKVCSRQARLQRSRQLAGARPVGCKAQGEAQRAIRRKVKCDRQAASTAGRLFKILHTSSLRVEVLRMQSCLRGQRVLGTKLVTDSRRQVLRYDVFAPHETDYPRDNIKCN